MEEKEQEHTRHTKQRRRRWGHSLTAKVTLSIIALVAFAIALCWFINSTFLQSFYIHNKEKTIVDGYRVIDTASESDILQSDDFDITFEKLCTNGNLSVLVFEADGTIIRSSFAEETTLINMYWQMLNTNDEEHIRVVVESDNYDIVSWKDTRMNDDYLVLTGYLSNGNIIIMRTAVESIRESVEISNRFLMFGGLLSIIIGAILAFFITRRLTSPILQLSQLSDRMAHLDFDAKFESRGQNEVDDLGEHMNEMSIALERTISELKTANNELQRDIERKEQMDEMRKEFLSNVSHELKTPIALIQGYSEGLKECVNEDDENKDFYCEVIMDEANKMNIMVQKLLTLNQIEFGTEQIVMERFDLDVLVRGVISATTILREQKEISLFYDSPGPVYAWADEFKVEEVVTNYMSNAIHHCGGAKQIRVTIENKEDTVRVCVYNTGQPIPEEDIPRLWEKFYKVDKARTREYGGSGIGLSIVKAILDSFHHECGVSNVENGVVFWFELDGDVGKK
jgi:signal transduction histidine kinase